MVDVLRPGALTTVQDLGRHGSAHLGVPRSGALDSPAHLLANRLVGNPPEAATLETTLDGCALRTRHAVTVSVTGAACAVTVNGRPAPWGAPVRVPASAVLELGPATHGVRSYLALCGGVQAPLMLGSRSTDLLSGLGPAPLSEGDELPLGACWLAPPAVDLVPTPGPARVPHLPLTLGPRQDWFTDGALQVLTGATFTVSPRSNRIGLRTDGPRLERAVRQELPSEGMVLGAVQVPPDGHPVLFLADHPTTGGYPVVGVVTDAGLAVAAQAAPGTAVRFTLLGGPRPPTTSA